MGGGGGGLKERRGLFNKVKGITGSKHYLSKRVSDRLRCCTILGDPGADSGGEGKV